MAVSKPNQGAWQVVNQGAWQNISGAESSSSISISSSSLSSVSSSSLSSLSSVSSSSLSSLSVTKSSSSSSSFSLIYADKNYSCETAAALKTDDVQLGTLFTADDYSKVAIDDDQYVDQNITNNYATFLFKDFDPTKQNFDVLWKGQTTRPPALNTVYLQVYNRTGGNWETLDSDNTTAPDTDFQLSGSIAVDLEDYYDANGWVACRVYQGKV